MRFIKIVQGLWKMELWVCDMFEISFMFEQAWNKPKPMYHCSPKVVTTPQKKMNWSSHHDFWVLHMLGNEKSIGGIICWAH